MSTEVPDKKCLYLWLGADGEVEEVSKEEFDKRQVETRDAWQAWIDLKDLEATNGTVH